MQNEILWRKNEEEYGVKPRVTIREIAIGLIAGAAFVLSIGAVIYIMLGAR